MAIFPDEPGLASFTGAKDNGSGGDNWSYRTCQAPVRSSPSTVSKSDSSCNRSLRLDAKFDGNL